MLNRIKLIAISIIALLAVIVVLQNTETVETRLLFFSLSMPHAALLFGALAIGFMIGVLVANRLAFRRQGSIGESAKDAG